MKMTKPKAINRKKLVAFALLVSNNSLHTGVVWGSVKGSVKSYAQISLQPLA